MAGPLQESQAWPIAPWAAAYDTWAENDAWFTGDPAAIEKAVSRPERATHRVAGEPHRGGVRGAVAGAKRWFWGAPLDPESQEVRLHVSAPADVASLSADLLFADPPDMYYPSIAPQQQLGSPLVRPDGSAIVPAAPTADPARQKRLELLASSDQARAAYLEGGAFASAFGAAAFRLVWDQQTLDRVWFEPVAPDVTIPEFRFGRLVAITFWTAYQAATNLVYRHLERHEIGSVQHTLYLGTANSLGRIVPLKDRPETASLADMIGPNGTPGAQLDGQTLVLPTGIDRLTAAWWINQPARSWRTRGALAEAGRSDYAGGVTGQFDALDSAWSSWINDLDLGRGRLIVPSAFLENSGRGRGATFDRSRSLFSGITAPGSAQVGLAEQIKEVQFSIRVEEHERTTSALYASIMQAAGLADDDSRAQAAGADRTATEVLAGGKAQQRTRSRKALYATMALSDLLQTAMLLDGVKFPGKGGGAFDAPSIEFPEAGQIDPLQNSTVVSNLRAAKVLSVWEGVARANPTWKDAEIQVEVDRLKQEGAIADPATVGNPAQDPEEAARNLPSTEDAARRLGLEVTGG